MKKFLSSILCLLLALSLVMCFAGCVSDKDDDDEKEEEKTSVEKEEKEEEEEEDDDIITPGGSTAVPVTPPSISTPAGAKVGTYVFYAGAADGMTVTAEQLEPVLPSYGLSTMEEYMSLKLKADGTGEMTAMGQTAPITWDESNLVNAAGEKIPYEFEDDMIAFEAGGSSVIMALK